MSLRISKWVWEREQSTKGVDRLVLLALAEFADDEGVCWPSVDLIVSRVNAARSTVLASLAALERGGLIARKRTGRATRYRVCGVESPDIRSLDSGHQTPGDRTSEVRRSGHRTTSEPSMKQLQRLDPLRSVFGDDASTAAEFAADVFGSKDNPLAYARSIPEADLRVHAEAWRRKRSRPAGPSSTWDRAVEVGSPEWHARHRAEEAS